MAPATDAASPSSRFRCDLAIAGICFLAFITVAYAFDLNESYSAWAQRYEKFELDELPVALAAMFTVFAWFAWRRWREYRREALDHRRTESELRVSEARFRDMLEAGSDRYWETDAQHRLIWRSNRRTGQRDFNYRGLGKTRWEAMEIDPQEDSNWAAHLDDLAARRPFRNFRYSIFHEGRLRHRSVNGKPIYDDHDAFQGYRGVTTDITQEIEAQNAAAETQAQFLNAIENIADGFALWRDDDTLIVCNERFAAFRGGGEPVRPGDSFETFFRASELCPTSGERDEAWVAECLERHRTSSTPYHVRHGSEWIEIREHHLTDGRTLTVTRDVTGQKEMEIQLHQALKMKVVGQLTGGIAHDFNNLLQVILGNLELIVEQLPADSKMAAQAKMAKVASERGADLIRRLMAFSRQQTLQPKVFHLNNMVDEMRELICRVLGADIAVRTKLAEELRAVYLDRVQAEAAFLNIAINARDAMANGGTLFIETNGVLVERGGASERLDLVPGHYVVLSITDTGTGMSPEVLARAFEPFFTTKEVGKGTGLGLSMIHGFVKQSGGDVKIYSEQGIGTAIKLYLPTYKVGELSDGAAPAASTTLRGNETILLVEDEELVRRYATAQLEQLGYHVISAADGNAALQLIQDIDGCVDLLFTDIVMPGGINGRALAEKVAAIYPNLRVLYASGYNESAVVHAGQIERGVVLLEKPYSKAELAKKLRQALDGGAALVACSSSRYNTAASSRAAQMV